MRDKGSRLSEDQNVTLIYGRHRVHGLVDGDTHRHQCSVWVDGRRACDCQGYFYNDVCSHIWALIEEIPTQKTQEAFERAIKLPEELRNNKMVLDTTSLSVSTELEAINKMFSPTDDPSHKYAGIPLKSGIAFSGRPKAGKTTLTIQLTYDILNNIIQTTDESHNALFFDTEGSIHSYIGWQDVFEQRYGLDTEIVPVEPKVSNGEVDRFDMERNPDADAQLFVMDVRDLQKILTIHGRPARVNTEEGKMRLMPNGSFPDDIRRTPIGQFVFTNDISVMTYDSVTNPIEMFTNRQQDRPTRAKATSWLMLQAQALAEAREMVQFYISHLSKNPANQYSRPDMIGGKNFKHQVKFATYLRESGDDVREMKLFRHPSKKPWEDEYHLKLEDGKGFVDHTE